MTRRESVIRDAVDDVELLRAWLAGQQALNANMTALVATLRGHVNNLLYAGMCKPEGNNMWSRTFAVPFAAVAVADVGLNGLTVSTGIGGEGQGPGTLIVPAGDFACVPLTGRSIAVNVGTIGATAFGQAFYAAVFTTVQPFSFGKL